MPRRSEGEGRRARASTRDTLWRKRRYAAWVGRRLKAHPDTAPLSRGLVARGRSIEAALAADADLTVQEVRLHAERDALVEALSEALPEDRRTRYRERLAELDRQRGILAADRAQIEARLAAEDQAFDLTDKVLNIRIDAL